MKLWDALRKKKDEFIAGQKYLNGLPQPTKDDLVNKGLNIAGLAPLGMLKKLYHGGTYVPGHAIQQKLYAAPDKRMAATYVDMYADRFGGNPKLTEFMADINKAAPADEVAELASKYGIDNSYYTPASAFDHNLHSESAVESLVNALRNKGYDHAVLPDVPYGSGRGGFSDVDETAYVLFPGVKTK